MPDFVILSCLSCNQKLKINDKVKRFVCTRCGTEYSVIRDQDLIYIKPVEDDVLEIQIEDNLPFDQNLWQVEGVKENIDLSFHDFSKETRGQKINERIIRLENLQVKFIESKKKLNSIFIISFLVLVIIVYIFLPVVESYEKLWIMLAMCYIPIIIVFSISFFSYQRIFNSNNNFIERKIQLLRKDLLM